MLTASAKCIMPKATMCHTSVVVFKNNHKRRMEMFKPTQLLKYKFYHFYFLKEVALQVAIVLYPAAFALRCFFFCVRGSVVYFMCLILCFGKH